MGGIDCARQNQCVGPDAPGRGNHSLGGERNIDGDREGARTLRANFSSSSSRPASPKYTAWPASSHMGNPLAVGVQRHVGHVFGLKHLREQLPDPPKTADHHVAVELGEVRSRSTRTRLIGGVQPSGERARS